jgi:hypothetical protein
MVGQGRPKASRAPFARLARARPWVSRAALVCLSCFLGALRANGDESLLQLRIAWGGGAERIWEGSIRLSGGRFSELQPLGLEADEPGSIWLDDEGIEIRQRALRAYDGVDVSVSADVDATLVVSLNNEQGETAKSVEVPLRSLLNQAHNSTLDDTGNRLIVTRSSNDRLRIIFERDHLVFSPGETLQFQLQSSAGESGGTARRYQVQVISSPGGQVISSTDFKAGEEGAASSIAVKLPDAEGVYDLSISSAQSRLYFRP